MSIGKIESPQERLGLEESKIDVVEVLVQAQTTIDRLSRECDMLHTQHALMHRFLRIIERLPDHNNAAISSPSGSSTSSILQKLDAAICENS